MDGKTEEWEGWLNKKKGQKKTPLKKKKTFLVHQFNFGEKKNQPESNDDEAANHVYALM